MIKQIETGHLPIKLWLDDIEDGAMRQAENLARLPFAFKHVAIMPDAHQGFGMPIGGVLATRDAIVPNAVGVDIGCGMCAIRTELREISQARLKQVLAGIRQMIPLGFNHHKSPRDESLMPGLSRNTPVAAREYRSALTQIGTLGGGNHFIEIQKGSDGYIWAMIHSGSRNIGKQVADHYNKLAISLANKMRFSIPKQWELAYLEPDTDEGEAYIAEMNFCVQFALANRKLMLECIREVIADVTGNTHFGDMINIAHNYASFETHYKNRVIIHRKGATSARPGEQGIIPGSQGTKSYIVRGLGNPESFYSCSHGAGRVLGRNQARKQLSLQDQADRLNRLGIIHSLRSVADLDEAPGAYKDIEIVMRNQTDLAEIVISLSPLAVVKG